ncbi:hypothetical protein OHB49_24210 [Streptomyces sp. NBC_01717]|uniref:hypothetical protein n=1 Tax=Streptomyces sp. NBC_01717 TaxID=2975918 RepID=UPI002E340A18|nr:hypothetical protein [Streptomyces sp. NBC_01717]
MQVDGEEDRPARAEAEALLRAGRLFEARCTAQDALDADGPDAGLYAVLGRSHAAEDADDEDDLAERVYRRGLAAFPDDLDLLAAYAELCLNSDPFDRPARYGHGPELAERLRELAPGSPQALRVEQAASRRGRLTGRTGPQPPSASRAQRHDAREALTAAAAAGVAPREAARSAREQADERPSDLRLGVRAETLAALARPGLAPLRLLVRAPLASLAALSVAVGAAALAVPALHLPWWVSFAGPVLCLPHRILVLLLRAARRRATTTASPIGAEAPDPTAHPTAYPMLQPVPTISRRELAVSLTAALVVIAAVTTAGVWSDARYRSYPHYTASPPAAFRGAQLLPDTPAGTALSNALTVEWDFGDGEPFTYIYGTPGRAQPEAMVFGATGDFHDTSPDVVGFFEQGLRHITSTAGTPWNADPGDDGGWLRCVAYTPVFADGAHQVACSWADKGSVGTVVVNEEGLDHESAAGLTRALRHAILHTGPEV